MKSIYVTKRDGRKEVLNYDKINTVLINATDKITGVSASDIAMNAKLQIYDLMSTEDIHKVLIQSTADLINEKNPNYQYVASNLSNYLLRKNLFGSETNLPHLYDIIVKNTDAGKYDTLLLEKYSRDDIDKINSFIKHERDYTFTYSGIQQLIDKYLLKDRKTDTLYETPQYAYICIAMTIYASYETNRLEHIKSFYDNISKFKINLPTPILSGVRTPNRQWSSCVLVDIGDSLDSIYSSNSAIGFYTSKRAGIGFNIGRLRALGDTIRGGEVIHTGVIPFLRMLEGTVKSCTQNGIRGGGATVYFPFWHKEIKDVIVLKNNKGTENNRVRKLDYCIQFCKIFYKRFIDNGEISLFSPNDVPGLYEAFGDNVEFDKLYEKYEKDKTISKTKVPARDILNLYCQERIGTGRLYLQNIDNVNSHSPFIEKITMSNLCVEISLRTSPINHQDDGITVNKQVIINKSDVEQFEKFKKTNDLHLYVKKLNYNYTYENKNALYKIVNEDYKLKDDEISLNENVELVYGDKPAEIALCVLSAINVGVIKNFQELELICEDIVRTLDSIISLQDYPVHAARKMLSRRSIGVGITNLAYFLAKNDLNYDDPKALPLIDELMENIQYYLIKASVKLAKEFGPCKFFNETTYSQGLLPIDHYNKNVDNLVSRPLTHDWEALRQEVLTYGMRNSTLSAIMPCESSSVSSNSTNGIEPARALITGKKSKQSVLKSILPDIQKLKNKYQLAFDLNGNTGIINIQSVIQKWVDQGISANHYYDFTKYPDGEIPLSEVAKDILRFYQYGGKQMYYANTYDGKTDDFTDLLESAPLDTETVIKKGTMSTLGGDCDEGGCSI